MALMTYFNPFACRRVAPLLFAQSEDADLSPREAARLHAHLVKCALCQREADEIAAFAVTLRQNAPPPSLPAADLWSRIEAEIAPASDATPAPSPVMRRSPAPFVPTLGMAAWASSFAIIFAGGAWMTFGGGFWGRAPQQPSASVAQNAERPPVTVTLVPSAPPTARPAAMAAANVAASPARKTTTGPSVKVPGSLAFVLHSAGSQVAVATVRTSRHAIHTPSYLASTAATHKLAAANRARPTAAAALAAVVEATPARAAHESVRVAALAVPPVSPASDSVADVVTPLEPSPSSEGSAKTTKTLYAFATAKPNVEPAAFADAAVSATAPQTEDAAFTRSVPPSGGNSASAFSVADAPTRARLQHALFSYSHP